MSGDNEQSGSRAARPLMPDGSRYAGQPIDVSSRHSVVIRQRAGRSDLIHPDDTHVTVDFFYHEGTFWRAIIPLDGVSAVCGQAFNFSKPKIRTGKNGPEIIRGRDGLPKRKNPFLYHVQSRVTFKPGSEIQLFSMDDQQLDNPAHRIDDFVYSVEVAGPVGIKFNLRDGLTGHLVSAHRFLSTREMVFERIVVENQYVTQSPPLPLTAAEKSALLVKALLRSHRAGMTEPYYLCRCWGTNNCTSNPLQLVDNVVRYGVLQRFGTLLYRLPINPRFYLRIRGLDCRPTARKLVRDEFDDYVRDEQTRQRKREYVKQRTAAIRDSIPR